MAGSEAGQTREKKFRNRTESPKRTRIFLKRIILEVRVGSLGAFSIREKLDKRDGSVKMVFTDVETSARVRSFGQLTELTYNNDRNRMRMPRWCSGLASSPVTAMTRVRLPTGAPLSGLVAQHGRAPAFYPSSSLRNISSRIAMERKQMVEGPKLRQSLKNWKHNNVLPGFSQKDAQLKRQWMTPLDGSVLKQNRDQVLQNPNDCGVSETPSEPTTIVTRA